MRKKSVWLLVGVFIMALAVAAMAGENPVQAKDAGSQPEVKKELIRLKFVAGADIITLIQSLLDLRHERVSVDHSQTILTLVATPENIEKVKHVIREVDIKPPDLLFTVQLVLGSETQAAGTDLIQNDPLIRELRNLLRYRSYTLLDSSFVRVVNRERAEVVMGPKAEFEFSLRPNVTGDAKAPVIRTELRLRQITRARMPENVVPAQPPQPVVTTLIESSLNVKSGERTVVGVSKLDGGDKGLILIISGKIVD